MDFSRAHALFYICIYVFKKETTLSDNSPAFLTRKRNANVRLGLVMEGLMKSCSKYRLHTTYGMI